MPGTWLDARLCSQSMGHRHAHRSAGTRARCCARTAAPSADVAKAYKNLDELLAQLRSSFYTGAATAGAGAGAGAAKGGQAEAAQSGRLRADASEEAAGPRPPPPPAYEEFDDGLGVHSRLP